MPSNLHRHDEPGHVHFWTISCYRRLGFFHEDSMKRIVIEGLRLMHIKFGICLIGYVVMPEHVHVLLYPHRRRDDAPLGVSKLLNAFKQFVGYHGKERLRDYWRRSGRLWSDPLNAWARGRFGDQPLWNTRGHDFNIDRLDTLVEKRSYCHKNPITRGLADTADQWPWSSFRYYEMGDRTVLDMDWDGRWPIIW